MRKYNYSDEVVLTDDEEEFELSIPKRYQNGSAKSYSLSDTLQDQYEWQVTYKFSSKKRPYQFLTQYGSKRMTFRRLYVILCERFNGGRYFIDDYFKDVYPYNGMKERVESTLNAFAYYAVKEYEDMLADAVFTKAGLFDKRFRRKLKELSEYKQSLQGAVDAQGTQLAREIKDDIIRCLQTGQIPLAYSVLSPATQEKRIKAGLPSDPKFFASGNFIKDITIYCRLEKKKWQTKYPFITV